MRFTQTARRFFLSPLVLLMALGLLTGKAGRTQDPGITRVRDLRRHIGQKVTIQGRTGYIAEFYEQPGLHVFSLRDDYNDQVFIRTHDKNYPVMGITYRVSGWPTRDAHTLFLDAAPGAITPAYRSVSAASPGGAQPVNTSGDAGHILPWLVAALLLAAGLAWYYLHQPPEWGDLVIMSGVDKGQTIPLRRHRITLGRSVSGKWDVPLPKDDLTISKKQAQVLYSKGSVYYRDLSSNGSIIGGKKVENGTQVKVASGDPIQIGMRGTVITIRLRAEGSGPGGLLQPPNPNDKTIMHLDPAGDTPVWDRETSYPSTHGSHEPRAGKYPTEFRAKR